MKFGMLMSLVAVLIASMATAWFLSRSPASSTSPRTLKDLFETVGTAAPHQSGGLLVHTMPLSQVKRLLRSPSFVLNGNDEAITDCSPQDGTKRSGSCSCWTYLRSDLMPMIFNTPTHLPESSSEQSVGSARRGSGRGSAARRASLDDEFYNTPCVGIMVDLAMAWPLVVSMGVVDVSSLERNCGQFPYDDQRSIEVQCTENDDGVGSDRATVLFQGPLASSVLCRRQCEEDDLYCKYQNSGSNITLSFLGKSDVGNWGCSDCSGPFPANGVRDVMAGCSQSAMPYICRLDAGPQDLSELVDPDAWAPYSKSQGFAHAHVGKRGEGFSKLFEKNGAAAEVWEINGNQCKFSREDWHVWVDTIKLFYRTFHKHYDPATKTLRTQGESSEQSNYQMSCPLYYSSFFENEVNMYFNPDSDDPHFKAVAEKQSDILRQAIVGFFSVGLTCEEQLRSLEGSPCSFGGASYTGSKDRCVGWYCGKTPSLACAAQLQEREASFLREAAALADELARSFNRRYRADGSLPRAGVFRYLGSNSTFLDPRYLDVLLQGGRLAFRDVFEAVDDAAAAGKLHPRRG
jgi:hypothetical protein